MSVYPMQPLVKDPNGIIRFKANPIVCYMLDHGDMDLNQLAIMSHQFGWTPDDRMQFAQLIGYSVSGYGDLSYASKESVEQADEAAEKLP